MLRPYIHPAFICFIRRRLDTQSPLFLSYRAAMRFLRCVHAELLLVVPRLTRTRLGVTLLVLGTTLVWLSARGFDALAIATGRWLAIVIPASALVMVCAAAIGSRANAVVASVIATAAVGSCALAVVLPLGRGAALALFLFMAVAGTIAPERLVDLARPGVVRLTAASAMELGPALWHYREIATGDMGATVHALAWIGLGILLASAAIGLCRSASS